MGQGEIRGGQNLEFVDTGPSRRLWAECPWGDIGRTVRGTCLFDDFDNTAAMSAQTALLSKYAAYSDTSCTILQVADMAQNNSTGTQGFGALALAVTATDDKTAIIQTGGNAGGLASFRDPAVATPHDIYFEARFKINEIATGNHFVGFADEGLCVVSSGSAGLIWTNNVLSTSKNYIGFGTLVAAPSTLFFAYQRQSATAVIPIASLATLVADTYINVGFHYRYAANPSDRKIMVYKNNVAQSVGVAKSAIVTATFPTVDALAMTAIAATSTTTAHTLTLDWWKYATVEN